MVSQGYKTAMVATPESKLNPMARKLINSGFSRILVEKPASLNSSELIALKDHADKHNCEVMIGYQRKYDPVFAEKLAQLRAKYNEGYRLDHTTVHSCDARQPPQAAPQYINQSCHDYAMLLNILQASGDMNVDSLAAKGVQWNDLNDTRQLSITGKAVDAEGNESTWDIMNGRVSD
mmetsp:Transcript_62853/g.86929  ORF Transcript_62853/g.86929 Transcript_62853/m.86929 type:complete len:177 (+) Transcript_62853:278-808(+)